MKMDRKMNEPQPEPFLNFARVARYLDVSIPTLCRPPPQRGTITCQDTRETGPSLYKTGTGVVTPDQPVMIGRFPNTTIERARKQARISKGEIAQVLTRRRKSGVGARRSGLANCSRNTWRGAAIADLRIYDIRRALGSHQAITGASLSVIGKALAHRSHRTTEIYARLDLDPVQVMFEQSRKDAGE
jgi:integrase